MWAHRKVILISLILILSLVSICLRKRKLKTAAEEPSVVKRTRNVLQDSFWLDMEINKTNLLYIFSLRRAPFWDCDSSGADSISAQGNKVLSIGDKNGNIQSGRNTLGERRKVKSGEDVNNANSANPVIISCILWLLLSLGKACFEMTNDLKERKRSLAQQDASRRFSLQNFSFARNERKSLASAKFCRRSTIESFQPATSFATNYELMRANEALRILNMTNTSPVLGRRCSVPFNSVRQLPRQSSLGCQSVLQRQMSGESGSPGGGVDRSPEGKRRMRLLYRH
ncbi:uncharacterized protein LOC132266173 [Phlebotomus argentipes]|uniref:uncharacterized protein LOC132266173 n=1 Tax=Phlebotomus argentipes TaxID=94469 RepID=UPI002892ECAC|nr:uncharacterized protein LOC132266173 [Phlebotomus argentipes]